MSSSRQAPVSRTPSSGGGRTPITPGTPGSARSQQSSKNSKQWWKAIYEYQAQTEDELSKKLRKFRHVFTQILNLGNVKA